MISVLRRQKYCSVFKASLVYIKRVSDQPGLHRETLKKKVKEEKKPKQCLELNIVTVYKYLHNIISFYEKSLGFQFTRGSIRS